MLVYLWFRFELIYGVGAVVACFHDTIITVGFFSLLNKDISLTVIAAILTLIGYSMNDTIVVYDRIRENIKLLRRENLADVVNKSINQTLSRTILTSGLTFLTVLSLYVFGGEVLRGFSLALVIGILIGTYSSIAVAAPMLVAYQEWRVKKTRPSDSAGGEFAPGKNQGKGIVDFLAAQTGFRGVYSSPSIGRPVFVQLLAGRAAAEGVCAGLRFWEQKVVSRCLSNKSVRRR